ncbi:CapA family protein [Pseudonocardia asaccharolytica]|uniref:CapA family protein n=1 Tax=Pseudonocardia asaccharolytica TaxID=54010 RepID=UPI0027D9C021|nr:CapA family protein [Pseudonocardia asaccharolytica]
MTIVLCGDVMLGRGVDQILPHPGDPALRERYVKDARCYVELAEAVNGPVPRPVPFAWPWGDAIEVLDKIAPDVRVINLETSITRSDRFAPRKGIHYRMNPANVACLSSARPDVCVLANNHVLDFGRRGLADTLKALAGAGLAAAGAGRDTAQAWRPAAVPVGGRARVLVFSMGTASGGIPASWSATGQQPGVGFVRELTDAAADQLLEHVRRHRGTRDIAVVSIHWGSNWGYEVSREQTRFAHRLIDGGVDVVHGHSSHHPRPVEVYRDRLILYGCGDFINDYEGIGGFEEYRDDLRLLYIAAVEPDTGALVRLRIAPLQAWRMRLWQASDEDAVWLRGILDAISRQFGCRLDIESDGWLILC